MGLALGRGLALGTPHQEGKGGGARLSGRGGSGGPSCSEASALVACVCVCVCVDRATGWASLPAWPCMAWHFVMACGQAWAILEPAGCDITWAFI